MSLKTKLFIEDIKRVQRLLCGPLMTSVSVFELPHLFCLLVPALNIFLISMEAGGSPQSRGTLQIRSQSSGIGIVSLRLTTNPTLETNKKTIWCFFLSMYYSNNSCKKVDLRLSRYEVLWKLTITQLYLQ